MAERLTAPQLKSLKQQIRTRLEDKRAEVREILLRADEEHYGELAGQVHDLEDQSLADLLVDVTLADIDRHVREIRALETALGRMAQDLYGICRECQADIGHERLQAYPTAERCVDCQAEYERTHAQPGRPTL